MPTLKELEDAVLAAQTKVLDRRGPHEAALKTADAALKAAAAVRDVACAPFHVAYRAAKAAALAAATPAELVYRSAREELDAAIVALENARKEVRADEVDKLIPANAQANVGGQPNVK